MVSLPPPGLPASLQDTPSTRSYLSVSRVFLLLLLALSWSMLALACGGGLEDGEELSGGDHTVYDNTRGAYMSSSPQLTKTQLSTFFVGNSFFSNNWVIAPASTGKRDGLGPTFNSRACAGCHFKDGRGRPPTEGERSFSSLLLRLSIPGQGPNGSPKPDPNYGGQLNNRSIQDVPAEGRPTVTYKEKPGQFADGETYSLRQPTYAIKELAYGPLHPKLMISPRVAPAVFGLGLLEAIPEKTLLDLADPDDKDGDGISGRVNRVWDVINKKVAIGRFGWKANQPSLMQQNAAAFLGDIGITSPFFPTENCPPKQKACLSAKTGGAPEVPLEKIKEVTLYTQLLAVPARRNWTDPEVLRGKALFQEAGCASCHVMKLTTGAFPEVPSLGNQTIRPYTDLLLHDMGEGLTDGRPDFLATGREWRTAPLWGIGLQKKVNRHTFFLHDGRARNLTEAILWHGGEGQASKEAFRTMPKSERQALLAFLQSL